MTAPKPPPAPVAPSPAAPVTARPWLARLHPSLFGMALGLLGLSGAWHRLEPAGVPLAGPVAAGILAFALGLLALLVLLWLAKAVRHSAVLRQELPHPVQGALLALMPVALLMAVALAAGRWPPARDALLPLALVVLAGQGWMAWRVVANLSTGKTPPELVTPALYLPTVPGGFVGAMALQALGFHGWATLLMGMGLGAWALLEMRILNRLFAGPLPLALRPTLGIEMAPAAVGSLAACTLWPALPADALMVMLGVASGPVLAVADALALLERGAVQRRLLVVLVSAGGLRGDHGGGGAPRRLAAVGGGGSRGGGHRGDGLSAGAHAGAADARAAAAAGVRLSGHNTGALVAVDEGMVARQAAAKARRDRGPSGAVSAPREAGIQGGRTHRCQTGLLLDAPVALGRSKELVG